ncbi:MAG TPA: aminoacyl--tRNA ligase-related protein [Candidatus Chromulinivoraceae bacterium]|nr:aminoacyl--tRNA ligase-related protein [Candidatus Chromulinivoraceae bacterium]
MKYFILKQDKKVVEIDDYLQQENINEEFACFVRREALSEILIEQSNDRPAYLQYANKLGFRWEPNADIGHVQYNYRANLMRRLVQDYARELVHDLGLPIYEVNGANMFSLNHPVVDAYASLYGDRLYQFKSGDHDVVMSYDASYPQFNLAAKKPLSYKQLPFAHFSISDCYRHEQSGEMMLLLRQRRFFMPDIHPYFKDVAEAFAWFPKLQAKIVEAANDAERKYHVVIEIPSEEIWLEYREYIEQISDQLGADVLVNILEDGNDRYWVVNVDYKIVDQLGQAREIGCIQVDIGNAPRLNIHYIDKAGKRKHPVIIHSAIPGGIERYLYLLFDQYEQKGLPLWLQPAQIRLLPVGEVFVDVCKELAKKYEKLPLRIEVDDRNINLSAKLKAAHEDLVPHKIAIGQREIDNGCIELDKLIKELVKQVEGKPFILREWPMEVSRQLG